MFEASHDLCMFLDTLLSKNKILRIFYSSASTMEVPRGPDEGVGMAVHCDAKAGQATISSGLERSSSSVDGWWEV